MGLTFFNRYKNTTNLSVKPRGKRDYKSTTIISVEAAQPVVTHSLFFLTFKD